MGRFLKLGLVVFPLGEGDDVVIEGWVEGHVERNLAVVPGGVERQE